MTIVTFPRNFVATELIGQYFADVYPTRGHGATDCGECMDGLSDAEHFIKWLAERGIKVVQK
jgi:hypothetical protein